MNSTANESQHSDNKSNTSADLQRFPNDQTDSNMTSRDSLFPSEKKQDASTIKEKREMQKNIVQRSYHQENLTIINSQKRACYYKRKLAAQHKHQEMNTEKETSFRDGK